MGTKKQTSCITITGKGRTLGWGKRKQTMEDRLQEVGKTDGKETEVLPFLRPVDSERCRRSILCLTSADPECLHGSLGEEQVQSQGRARPPAGLTVLGGKELL